MPGRWFSIVECRFCPRGPEPVDRNEHRVVELLSHSVHRQVSWLSWKVYLFWTIKKRGWCSIGGILGKVQAERSQGGDSQSDIVLQLESLPRRHARLVACVVFADARAAHGVMSGCDSSENGFPHLQDNDGHGHACVFCFWFQVCCTAAIHSARLCGSFGKEKRRSWIDPAPARV